MKRIKKAVALLSLLMLCAFAMGCAARHNPTSTVSVTHSVKRSGTPPSPTGSLYDEKFEDGKLSFFNQWSSQYVRLYAVKGTKTDFYDVTGGEHYVTLYLSERKTYTIDIYTDTDMLWLFPDDGTYTCVFTTHDTDILQPTSGSLFTVVRNRPTVPLPAEPVQEGHTFGGWYYDEAFTQPYDGAPIYADTVLYAKMDINRYTVQFNGQNDIDYTPVTVDWNTVPTLPTPERTGFDFVGWYDGDTLYEGAPIKENKTLTAHWEIQMLTVTFLLRGETYKTVTVEYGTTLVEAMEEAEIASYAVYTDEGVRLSKQNSIITEDTQVLVQDLNGWEKYGDFVSRSPWYTWLTVGVLGALAVTTVVMAIVIKKRG